MREHIQEGDQAPILTANSWDHFITIYPSLPPTYSVQTQYSPLSMILPFECASNGLSGIPLTASPAQPSTRSHEFILDSPLGQINGYHTRNDLVILTLSPSGQFSSGPTFSNFVPPSISPGSQASPANPPRTDVQHTGVGHWIPTAFNPVGLSGKPRFTSNGVAKSPPAATQAFAPQTSLRQFDRTVSANDPLFMGPQWGGVEMNNSGVSEQKIPTSHILYDRPQGAPVDIVTVSNPPYEVPVLMPFPEIQGTDSNSLYRRNSQYQHSLNSIPQGNNDSAPYLPGTLLDHFPISDASSTPLTVAEKEWILSIELVMRNSSTSPPASEWDYAGSSSVAAPTSFKQDWHNTCVPSQLFLSHSDISSTPEHRAGSSSTVDEYPQVKSSRQQSPLKPDLGSPPQFVPSQSIGQLLTEPDMSIKFPLNMAFHQPPSTTPSSVLNAPPNSQPTPIVHRRNRKRRRELEPDYDGAQSDDSPISATCEWDGCGEHLASVGDFKKHFIKSGTDASKHNLAAGNNSKTQTICLWGNCQKPVACLWRHLWEVHGGFPRSKRRRL